MIHRAELDQFFVDTAEPHQLAQALRERGTDPELPYRKHPVPDKDAVIFEQDRPQSQLG